MHVNLHPSRASIGEELLFIASKTSWPRAFGSTKQQYPNWIGKAGWLWQVHHRTIMSMRFPPLIYISESMKSCRQNLFLRPCWYRAIVAKGNGIELSTPKMQSLRCFLDVVIQLAHINSHSQAKQYRYSWDGHCSLGIKRNVAMRYWDGEEVIHQDFLRTQAYPAGWRIEIIIRASVET